MAGEIVAGNALAHGLTVPNDRYASPEEAFRPVVGSLVRFRAALALPVPHVAVVRSAEMDPWFDCERIALDGRSVGRRMMPGSSLEREERAEWVCAQGRNAVRAKALVLAQEMCAEKDALYREADARYGEQLLRYAKAMVWQAKRGMIGQKAHEQEVGAITPGERDERDAIFLAYAESLEAYAVARHDASFAYAVTEAARRDLAVAKVGAGVP